MKLSIGHSILTVIAVSGIFPTCPALSARDFVANDLKARPGATTAVSDRPTATRGPRIPMRNAVSPAKIKTSGNTPFLKRLPGGNTVLCGAMVYNDLWGMVDENNNFLYPIDAGMFTIQAKPNGTLTRLNTNNDLIKMRAGVKANSIYYVISTTDYDSSAILSSYYTSSWSRRSNEEIDIVNVPTDMTYDPVTGNIYGFFYNDETQEYDRFCRFDTYYGEAEQISTVDRNGFAIAANSKGEIYGIWGYTGWLIKINPATGRYEQIGRTGFSPGYVNSMTFDDATGKLYWTANDGEGYSALLEVNTSTGEATEIMHFENNASFAGIFAQPYKVPDNAPAAVSDIKVNSAVPGSCAVTISCTAPTKTANNASLSESLTIAFTAGDKIIELNDIQPGATAVTPEMTLPAGLMTIDVVAATSSLLGEQTSVEAWIGEDLPGMPVNVSLGEKDGKPALAWEAPAKGQHDGWFDASTLTYTITRYPGAVTFNNITGTSWVDESWDGSGALYYTIRSVGKAGESESVTTSKMVFGQGYTVPFTETFSTADDFSLWTVIDLNGHTTWQYDSKNKNIYYNYDLDVEAPGDDWIISPKVKLEAGKTYRFSTNAKSYYKGYKENFRVMLGTAPQPEAMTMQILDCPDFDNPSTGETKRASFTVDADGDYHLGIYCYSPAHNWRLTLDDISVTEISSSVAAAVTDLTMTAADNGALEATLSMTAPAVDSKGVQLTDPLNINIYRNHAATPATTLTDVTPGTQLTWTDKAIAESDMYHYRVVAVTETGEGADATVEGWVGVDTPGAVTNLKAIENEDGSINISWEAPVKGAHGGWFDPAGMTYRVVRSNDAAIIAEATTATSLVDNPRLSKQELLYYLVTPYIGSIKGQYNNTDFEIYGPAIIAPVNETFTGADMDCYPWVSDSDGSQHVWSLETAGIDPATTDQSGDQGMAMFIATAANKGLSGTLSSPKINISALDNPVLTFWMYHTAIEGENNADTETLEVLAGTMSSDFTPIDGATFTRGDDRAGWKMHIVSLDAFKGSKNLRICFKSKSLGLKSFYIDNITVGEATGVDVAATSFNGPSRTAVNVATPFMATVTVQGTDNVTNVVATISSSGKVLSTSPIGNMSAGESRTIEMPVTIAATGRHSVTLDVKADGETDLSNNASTRYVDVVETVIPSPQGLAASQDDAGNVSLSWKDTDMTPHVVDDMETYDDWAITGIGDFTTIDLDGDYTYHINKDLGQYPNCNAPKAFQVCNAKTLGIDIWDEGKPHSGNKMLMSIASMTTTNNDWLILPRLNGTEQSVTFHAKAFTSQDTPAERMRILYSTTDANPQSFTPLHTGEYIEVPDVWTEYSRVVPQGTNWVAINCVSHDAFALFIDDIAFNDFTVLTSPVDSYIIYRDGVEVARTSTPEWVDVEPIGADGAVYKVAALYKDGTLSAPSEEIRVTYSGIASVGADNVKVVTRPGQIEVTGADDDVMVVIAGVDGRIIAQSATLRRFDVAAGWYIVTVGNRVFKVTVR